MTNDHSLTAGSEPPLNVFDVHDALSRLADDRELLCAIIQIYVEDSPAILRAIHVAAEREDGNALRRAAHSLKGLAATLSAGDLLEIARRLEHMGICRQFGDASAVLAELNDCVKVLDAVVQRYIKFKS